MVEVWLDRYSEQYYREVPSARSIPFGDVADRRRLRTQLHCHPFQWYIDNVYPELGSSTDHVRGDRYGKIQQGSRCLIAFQPSNSTSARNHWRSAQLRLDKCIDQSVDDGSQDWTLAVASTGLVRVGDQCLTSTGPKPGDKVFLQRCSQQQRLQKWILSRAEDQK